MSLGDSLTWADWVRLVAADVGVHALTDQDVDWLLWERTAWPCTNDPAYLRPQVEAALSGPGACPCCAGPLVGEVCGVCRPCAERHGWVPENDEGPRIAPGPALL